MRRTLPSLGILRDRNASAPFAVVAVLLLLGAGLSYAYLSHLQQARMGSEGLSSWTDEAQELLEAEARHVEEVVAAALDGAIDATTNDTTGTPVSAIASVCREELTRWAEERYPTVRDHATVAVGEPRFSVSPVHGTVTTGNVLGQQVPQRLPVGVEAVAAVRVEVTLDSGGRASRDVLVRAHRTVPRVLAAYLQDMLEYSMADEGLVPVLLADALRAGLANDPSWEPDGVEARRLVHGAIGAVQRSLFHGDTEAAWVDGRGGDGPVDGADVVGVEGPARVLLEMAGKDSITIVDPFSGRPIEVQMVPWVQWVDGPNADLATYRLWGAEAGGPADAAVARLDCGGSLRHHVDILVDGRRSDRVSRDTQFRAHVVSWFEGSDAPGDGGVHFRRAQVEDWEDLGRTMVLAAPPPRTVLLDVPDAFGPSVQVSLDAVPVGIFPTRNVTLANVLAGPHELTVSSMGPWASARTCSTGIDVPADGQDPVVAVGPGTKDGSEARQALWFALMASFHGDGAGPLAHLERIAELAGYPPLPEHIRGRETENLADVALWVDGLDHCLDFSGRAWDACGVEDPAGAWGLAKEIVSLTRLTHRLLLKVPKAYLDAGRAVVLLSSVEGRARFVVRCPAEAGAIDLLTGTVEGGGCVVQGSDLVGRAVARVGDVMTALSVIGSALSIAFDVVELVEALGSDDGEAIAWASVDLGIDIAKLVLTALGILGKVGIISLGALGKSALSVVGSAIAVVATFLDAYREAGNDFWGAWDLLLHPDGLSGALRSAGFFSAMASLVTTAVVTVALPALTGATLASAFATAVLASTGVGLIVFGAVLVIWAIFHWDEICGWVLGTVDGDVLKGVRRDVESALVSTLDLRARLNAVDVLSEIAEARSERGLGLALMHLRTTCGDAGLVEALGRADLHHLDGGSAQGRRARAVAEVRHWIEVLWREVDDLVDEGREEADGEESEGFKDYKGDYHFLDLVFDADIKVSTGGGEWTWLDQSDGSLVDLLRSIDEAGLENTSVKLVIHGEVLEGALDQWVNALGAVTEQLGEASTALARASREAAFLAGTASETAYDRGRGLVEVHLPEWADRSRLELRPIEGSVMVDGRPVEGLQAMELVGTTAMLTVDAWSISSRVVDISGSGGPDDVKAHAACDVHPWHDLRFGESLLDHTRD